MAKQLKFKKFPQDNVYYRIDILGHVRKNFWGGSSGLLVDILMSPIINPDLRSFNFKDVISQPYVDPGGQIRRNILVSELVAIESGCVFRNGVCVWRPPRYDEKTLDIDVRSDTVQVVNSYVLRGLNNDSSFFLKSHYQLGEAFSSNFLAVRVDDDPYGILIPIMELIRFYYLASSKYSQAIFTGELNNMDNFVNEERMVWYPEDKMLFIKLRQDYKYSDGWLIAQLLRSPFALKSARNIYGSIKTSFYNNENYSYTSPVTGFPFWGKTRLRALYKSVKCADGRWRKLVLTLRNCSHPFPYEKLCMSRDNCGDPGLLDEKSEREGKEIAFPTTPITLGLNSNGEDVVLDPYAEGDSGIKDEEISIAMERFAFLHNNRRVPFLKLFSTYRSADRMILPSPEKGEDHSTGPQSSGSDALAPASIAPDDTSSEERKKDIINPKFDDFIGLVNFLERSEDIFSVKFLKINNADDALCNGCPVSLFPVRNGVGKKKIKWSIVNDKNKERPRMAFLTEIQSRWGTVYLLEIEPRKKRASLYVFADLMGNVIGEYTLEMILYHYATRKGKEKRSIKQIFERFKLQRINHEAVDAEAYAQRVLMKIKSVCC